MSGKKFYLTKDGLKRIQDDYGKLKKARQIKLSDLDDTPEALSSEELNPDYVNFHEDLGFLDSRIAELEYILKNAEPIRPVKGIIGVGTIVTVSVNGEDDQLTIVESFEANPEVGMISKESPVGKALLGKKEGDEITISSPIKIVYKIKKIQYFTS